MKFNKNTTSGMFKMLEKLNNFYFMLRGNKLQEKVATEENINAFLIRQGNTKVKV